MRGERLGAYRIGSEPGSGGMGTVYLATLEEAAHGLAPGDRVAIKVIHPHLLDTENSLERFRRKGDLGRHVRHENILVTGGHWPAHAHLDPAVEIGREMEDQKLETYAAGPPPPAVRISATAAISS